jgi:uncharacterized protein (TIGR02001 family)
MRLFMSQIRNIKSKQQALAADLGLSGLARAVAASTVLLAAAPLHAQVSVSATVASEYTSRGLSLSKGRLAPQLRVDYDSTSGWYAGALLSRAALPYSDASMQAIVYGGYSGRLAPGLAWEAGALQSTFVNEDEYRYHEFYAGLSRERLSTRVYFSPAYYGHAKTMYAEVNASYPLGGGLSVVGHAGFLHPFSDQDGRTRERLDLRLGLGYAIGDWNLQLALLANAPSRHGPQAPRAVAASATWGF